MDYIDERIVEISYRQRQELMKILLVEEGWFGPSAAALDGPQMLEMFVRHPEKLNSVRRLLFKAVKNG